MKSNFHVRQTSFPGFLIVFVLLWACDSARADFAAFHYEPIDEEIVGATFSADFAALVAHRTLLGVNVNEVVLLDVVTGLPQLDLSDAIFGKAAWPGPAMLDQGPLETGLVTVDIDPSFFPALQSGQVGLKALFTDTDDGLFAMDFLSLTIESTAGTIESLYGWPVGLENNGFGLGLADDGALPSPLPDSIPIGATGTGFDESIGSKSILVPEPGTVFLVTIMILLAAAWSARRRRMPLCSTVMVVCALPVAAVRADVVLNEILYFEDTSNPDPMLNHEWVELFNGGSMSEDLAGWAVTDQDGLVGGAARPLPGVFLPPGGFLVVHFAVGINDLDFSDGAGSYYTGDVLGIDLLDTEMDEAALYSPLTQVDFVAWDRDGSNYQPGLAHDEAVLVGGWTAGTFLRTDRLQHRRYEKFRRVLPGTSIGRNSEGEDDDVRPDWDTEGGENSGEATPGDFNFEPLPFVLVDGGNPPAKTKWTLMYYMDGDNNLEEATYDDLKELENVNGSDANVNVVVMYDGFEPSVQASVDNQGDIDGYFPETFGEAWRFQVGPKLSDDYIAMYVHGGDNPHLGEVNMGDPDVLEDFVDWAKMRYPADKYGLSLGDHGLGWKGICWDDTSEGIYEVDSLQMGEIAGALDGEYFEFMALDACLMGMIEVAWQVEPVSKFFLASEEVESDQGYPHDQYLPALKANPNWTGGDLGARIVEEFHKFYTDDYEDDSHTLSCIDQREMAALVQAAGNVGMDLRDACADFGEHDDPADNVEELIRANAVEAERFSDNDFVDLCDLAMRLDAEPAIPECYKEHLEFIFPDGSCLGTALVAEAHGPNHTDAAGLSIYMPQIRTANEPDEYVHLFDDCCNELELDSYDYPSFSRVDDGDSQRTMYAPNADCLPKKARDVENGNALAAPSKWPLLPAADFRFPKDTLWDEFLQRFYHPVADNHIVSGFCPCGVEVEPVVEDPECGNPVDEITILCGWAVAFSGEGSSDADTIDPLLLSLDSKPRHWMWDFDDSAKGCVTCTAPYEVNDGEDASKANDDMNADQDCAKAPLNDEKEDDAEQTVSAFFAAGDYVVTLNVWDDNHTFSYHDTTPTAEYVHPQTASHTSIVHVICPDQLHLVGPVPNNVPVDEVGVVTVSVEDDFVGQDKAPVLCTRLAGDFQFTSGEVSLDGSQTLLLTGVDGLADLTFLGVSPGYGLIEATLPGMELTAYAFFQIVEGQATLPACPGDVNGDGTVDPLDSGFILARLGCAVGVGDPACDDSDANEDGAVDPLDNGYVLARFGDCPE